MTIAYETPAPPTRPNRGLFWLALATTLCTFPLIFMGGLVTSHDAGLSVPDWPNSYGYNMFLFPPSQWASGVFFEHTHRLLGTLVGFFAVWAFFWAFGVGRNEKVRTWLKRGMMVSFAMAIGLSAGLLLFHTGTLDEKLKTGMAQVIVGFACLMLFLFAAWTSRSREPRAWVRELSFFVLVGVIAQGILGGLRVTMLKLDLAVIHGCVAQAFFCFGALLAIVTSKWWTWIASDQARTYIARPRGGLITLTVFAWLIVYGQLILGATMRHYRAGLSIPDLPKAYDRWLPPMSEDELTAALERVPAKAFEAEFDPADPQLSMNPNIGASRLTRVWLAYGHRLGALAVSAMMIWLSLTVLRKHLVRGLTVPAALLLVLLQLQLTLGVLVVLLKKPADITSYHVATGALVLVTTFVLVVRAIRVQWVERGVGVLAHDARLPTGNWPLTTGNSSPQSAIGSRQSAIPSALTTQDAAL